MPRARPAAARRSGPAPLRRAVVPGPQAASSPRHRRRAQRPAPRRRRLRSVSGAVPGAVGRRRGPAASAASARRAGRSWRRLTGAAAAEDRRPRSAPRSPPGPRPGRRPPLGPAGGGRPLPSSRAALPPMARRSGGANSPKVRRSAGSTTANASALQPGQPAVGQAEQLVVVQQEQAAAGQESLDPAGRGRGRSGGRQLPRHPRRRLVRGERARVEQQPGQPPVTSSGGQRGRYPGQRVQPAGPAPGVGEQADRRVHGVDRDPAWPVRRPRPATPRRRAGPRRSG